ncbi:MAG: hypothetical protein HY696_00900 [Deltaproteobacteria bacterium]|nr:hypothetical protein [Deltaproteobacteria bacterium]
MSKMIIVGTGASAAIDLSRFPTMDNFFQGILVCAKSDEDKRLIANFLSILDYERIFTNKDIKCENLAAQWSLFMPPNRLSTYDNEYKINLRDRYLEALRNRFSNKHITENLEILLDRSLNVSSGSSFSSTLYMLNWLLGYRDVDIEKKSDDLYHKLFDRFIGDEKQCSLVSFNYDLLLDCSLISWLKKTTDITDKDIKSLLTRCDSLQGFLNPSDISIFDHSIGGIFSPTPSPQVFSNHGNGNFSRLRLIKPHGSLAFTKINENKETYLLLNDGNFVPFPPVHQAFDHHARHLQPLIVPPTQNKIKSHPILFEAERHFIEKLSSPDTRRVVVIGWSLPPTDKDHDNIIRQCISNRAQQIEELIVIDLKLERKEKDPHFDRMESIFRPKVVKKCWEGFNEESVERYII